MPGQPRAPFRRRGAAPAGAVAHLRAGAVEVDVVYAPRPEYGIVVPLLSHVNGGVTARGGAEWRVLSAPVPMEFTDSTVRARLTLGEGDTVRFALHRSTLQEQPAHVWTQDEIATWLAGTIAAWKSWSQLHRNYEGPWEDLVRHSGRVPQALTVQPSGAIVAAAATSLPESVGGERKLGLPLLLGARRQLHHGGAAGGRLP